MSDTYVPLISSGVAGPLGVLHLPRLWQKVSLEEKGKLASGYPGVGKGFDAMTLAALGLEEQAVRNYIKQNKPTYPEFEAWVKNNAKSLNRDAIEKHNAAVRGRGFCIQRRGQSEQSRRLVRVSPGSAEVNIIFSRICDKDGRRGDRRYNCVDANIRRIQLAVCL